MHAALAGGRVYTSGACPQGPRNAMNDAIRNRTMNNRSEDVEPWAFIGHFRSAETMPLFCTRECAVEAGHLFSQKISREEAHARADIGDTTSCACCGKQFPEP